MAPNIMSTNNNEVPPSPIQQFFSGSTILITGATGFMGKCLLEKLLRCCPDLEKIYILVREKRGKKADGRVEEIFQDVLFTKLKSVSEKYRSKVVAISGDISSPGLGLSLHDRALLQQDVQVVFHVAATVNFNEKLKLAVAINVNGTKEILDLCKGMPNLKSAVHVSTAYSNCHQPRITESFYKYPISYKDIPSLLDQLDDSALDELTPRLLGDFPNTYTFTKAMAESLVQELRGCLPLSVFRPAIVVSTWKEPIQGWIDNIYGPTGICAGAMMGVLGSLWVDDRIKANIVPVDYTVNALIACAWETGVRKDDAGLDCNETELEAMYQTPNLRNTKYDCTTETDYMVFNYVSAVEKPITWGEYCGINMIFGRNYPLSNALWCLNFSTTRSNTLHRFYMFFLHFIPALLVDCASVVLGRKPRLLKIYKQTNKFANILSYFSTNEFQFTNDNTQRLWRAVDSRDKELFPFSMSNMNWLDYFRTYVPGIRRYLCKDDDSTIQVALQKQNRIRFASMCLKLILYYIVGYIVISIFKKVCTF